MKWDFYKVPEYAKIDEGWKKPLAKKQEKKEKQVEREALRGPAERQDEIIYVHNAEVGVTLPPAADQIFAVIRLLNRQHKVSKDDRVMVEKLPFSVGQQICIDDVLMVGTKDYTAIGRPQVTRAKVYATVEEQNQTEKVIYFKLSRRSNYQRNGGHRQTVNVLRIDSIEHEVTEEDFKKDVSLLKKPTEPQNFIL